jgi:hypothetical protein
MPHLYRDRTMDDFQQHAERKAQRVLESINQIRHGDLSKEDIEEVAVFLMHLPDDTINQLHAKLHTKPETPSPTPLKVVR